MIGVFALIGTKLFKGNEGKTKVKTRITQAETTLDKVNSDTIERLSKELKKESGRANRLQALKDQWEGNEEEEEEQTNQVSFEEITAIVKQKYPKYAFMLPFAEEKIMEITKGMSLPEILDYVAQITGNKESKPGDPASISQGSEFRPDYA